MATIRQQALKAYQAFLIERPVFTLDDLSAIAGGVNPRRTALERVKYYVETGRLRRLARELYAVVPQGVSADVFSPDAFLVAAAFRSDAVFSHHSALELLGAGHSDWSVCTAYTAGRATSIRWGSRTLRLLKVPAEMLGAAGTHGATAAWSSIGVREVAYRGRTLRVTGPERTLVEGFRQPRWVGGLAELVESASGFASLDLALLRNILTVYDQRSLWAAVGWFLEQNVKAFHVTPGLLDEFAQHRPKSTQYLLRGTRGGVFASRWNLILPPELSSRGEPGEPIP